MVSKKYGPKIGSCHCKSKRGKIVWKLNKNTDCKLNRTSKRVTVSCTRVKKKKKR